MSTGEFGPRIGIAPDSWGVWNAVDPAQPGPEQYLREIREAGFQWTELGPFGYLGADVHAIRAKLSEHELAVSAGTVFTGLHRGAAELESAWPELARIAEFIQALGAEHLIVIPEMWQRGAAGLGAVESARTYSDDEWDALCRTHNELGRRLWNEFGLRQQFHSHAESPVGSEIEIRRLLAGTDSDFMNLCLDTGHYAYYFGDSVSLIETYPDRIGYLHLKQVNPVLLAHVLKNDVSFVEAVADGVMVEPPHGVPGYAEILAAAQKANPGIFAVIEQDMYPVGDFSLPLQIARRTHEYIASCGVPVTFSKGSHA